MKIEVSKNSPAKILYDELKTLFEGYINKRESEFKNSPRWGYLKSELLKAAKKGKKEIIVKDTNKDFGSAKDYTEWEVLLFAREHEFSYYFKNIGGKDFWRICW